VSTRLIVTLLWSLVLIATAVLAGRVSWVRTAEGRHRRSAQNLPRHPAARAIQPQPIEISDEEVSRRYGEIVMYLVLTEDEERN
jgi:hypothetical protein